MMSTDLKKKALLGKIMMLSSLISSFFLVLLYINYTFIKLDFVLIGVIREIITIPCILAQPIILFLSLKELYLNHFKGSSTLFISAIVSFITLVFVIISFL